MRRRLSILLATAAIVGAQLGPAPASGAYVPPPAPSIGAGHALPAAPAGYVAVDQALTGDTAWAVLDAGDPADLVDRSLWRTPSDGTGTWTAYVGDQPDTPLAVRYISSSGGQALGVRLPGGDTGLILPDGLRVVAGDAQVAQGGRLVVREDAGRDVVESLDGTELATGDELGAGDGLAWSTDGKDLIGRPVLDGGDDAMVKTHEVLPCVAGPLASRGRWVVATCEWGTLVADRTGALRPMYTLEPQPGMGDGFLVVSAFAGGRSVLDPTTTGSTKVVGAVAVAPDAVDNPRVIARYADGGLRVLPIGDLAPALPPDTTAPTTQLYAAPTLDLVRARAGGSIRTDVTHISDYPAAERHEMLVSGVPTVVTPVDLGTEVSFADDDPNPCVRVRATDRAGNVGEWVEHCFAWDAEGPRVVEDRIVPFPKVFREVRMGWRSEHVDQSEIKGYLAEVRTTNRFGRVGPWRYNDLTTTTFSNSNIYPGETTCILHRGVDEFDHVGEASGGCATAPWDSAFMSGGDLVYSTRIGALNGSYTRLTAGEQMQTPQRMYGRVAVAKVRRGPAYGVADVTVAGRAVKRVNLRWPTNGWRWVTYVSPTPIEARLGVRAVRGPVVVDAIGISRQGDTYPPRQ